MTESIKKIEGKPKRLKLKLRYRDYFHQVLEFKWPAGIDSEKLSAVVRVMQPYGFNHELTVKASRCEGQGEIDIEFPLIDEGRYSASGSTGLWDMGRYLFKVELKDKKSVVGKGDLELDPNSFFGEINGQKLAQVDSLRQFIECCSDRPVYIDYDEISFTIRTLSERVKSCKVEVDIVEPKAHTRLAGPVRLDLTSRVQHHTFKGKGWPRGEYWLRVRVLRNNQPVGPYLVRQFWRETSFELKKPELPLFIGNRAQYMVDDWVFASSSGLRHEPDQLERLSDGPIIKLDRPWEKGPKSVFINSLSWDAELRQYRVTYFAGPISKDPKLWQTGHPTETGFDSIRYLCLALSSDGVHWEKPDLGYVEFKGSKRNNILRDTAKEDFLSSGEYDSYPFRTKNRPLPKNYRYRFYDPQTDGPVDMDRFVFRAFEKENMEPDEQFEGGFYPEHGSFWGFERRGDLFLALTPQPVLYAGNGMGLHSTLERASTYPFEGEKMALFQTNGRSTCTFYDRKAKTFYYYFRPDCPAYPPNGVPYYLWHGFAGIRTRAVMWTSDGIHWKRRQILSPDEYDVPGTTLYGFGFLRPVGHEESNTDGQFYMGALLYWDLRMQITRQELVWSRDHTHWHRFGDNRKPLLSNGPVDSYDASIAGLSVYYPMSNADGEEEWWFPYNGRTNRYMLGSYPPFNNLEEFKAMYPYFQLVPFFTNWEDFYEEAISDFMLPALARCKAGRLAHVEPMETGGESITYPVVSEGSRLLVNAQTDIEGSLKVEVQDAEGNVLPGFALEDSIPFSGDHVAQEVRWKRAGMEELNCRVIRLRFVLKRARLYTFRIVR